MYYLLNFIHVSSLLVAIFVFVYFLFTRTRLKCFTLLSRFGYWVWCKNFFCLFGRHYYRNKVANVFLFFFLFPSFCLNWTYVRRVEVLSFWLWNIYELWKNSVCCFNFFLFYFLNVNKRAVVQHTVACMRMWLSHKNVSISFHSQFRAFSFYVMHLHSNLEFLLFKKKINF